MSEIPPPWHVFPALSGEEIPRQGAEEQWIDKEWRPFWLNLSDTQREDYLNRWNATDAWRSGLQTAFDSIDIEQDAAESQAYLQNRTAKKKSFWQRLFSRHDS